MTATSHHPRRRTHVRAASAAALGVLFVAGPLALSAQATVKDPGLKSAANFSVLAGTEITNIGPSTVGQSIGVFPGTSLPDETGANALTVGGTRESATPVAQQAQTDLTTAYTAAANETVPNAQDTELGGETLKGGIYKVPTTEDMGLNGTLTLDGENKTGSTWVFQAGRALTVGSGANIVLTRGANPCNVFWQVSSQATLGTASHMIGTIVAHTSVVMQTGATLQGRALAQTAAVTMDHNVITSPLCRGVGGPSGTGGTPGGSGPATGGTSGTTSGSTNGGTGSTTGSSTTTTSGTGTGTGVTTTTTTSQVTTTPTGSVDTGKVGPVADHHHTTGWLLAAGFGGLALFAVRRRRVM